ncbi:hypothetical protein [Paracoccus laeviglucosivorans]|uniref:PKD domain-containing protein n=1 Tax=Paracoccus laeviglucosivorans TaxID=1197861 RepID=A0A521BZ06_9RHOB|nr:hypothetical protein [Paracoccus laeviglucosivorans]SMO52285.1 hypothetical protein SAMN06265221_103265 [Paracoccus laeviglucosivorans]
MALTILDGLGKALFDNIAATYIGAQPVRMLDSSGDPLTQDQGAVLPAITRSPTILPAAPAIGQSITLDLGHANGTPEPVAEWDFTLDGISIRDMLDAGELTMELTSPGVYALTLRWTNSAGSVEAETQGFTVVAVPVPVIDYDRQALCYFDAHTTHAGTAGEVASVTARGTGAYVFAATGSGAAIQHDATGFGFGDGAYLQCQTLSNQPTTDGLFAVVDVTLTAYGSNAAQMIDGTGGHVKIRNSAGSLQATGSDDSALTQPLGSVEYGRRMVLAAQIDDVLDLLSGHDAAGNLVSLAHPGLTDPTPNRFSCGRFMIGTIHRLAIVGRPEGQPWPVTMQEVVADFRRGA